jgi:para-nitrobenzyl esterase
LRLDVMTDERYAIPTTRLADAQSGHAPVWRSRYDGPLTGLPAHIAPSGSLPAFHGTDAAGIWTGGEGVNGQLHDAWAAFITTGLPGATGLPAWPGYSCEQRPTMIFDARGSRVENDPAAERRRAWEGRDWQSGTWFAFDGIPGPVTDQQRAVQWSSRRYRLAGR